MQDLLPGHFIYDEPSVPPIAGTQLSRSTTSLRGALPEPAIEQLNMTKSLLDISHLSKTSLERRYYDFIKPTARAMKMLCSKTFTETPLDDAAKSSQIRHGGKHPWDNYIPKSHSLSNEDITFDEPCLPHRTQPKDCYVRRRSKSCNDLQIKSKSYNLTNVSKTVQQLLAFNMMNRDIPLVPCGDKSLDERF